MLAVCTGPAALAQADVVLWSFDVLTSGLCRPQDLPVIVGRSKLGEGRPEPAGFLAFTHSRFVIRVLGASYFSATLDRGGRWPREGQAKCARLRTWNRRP